MREDGEEYRALTGWVGCPNCEGPVNVRALLEQHTSDLLLTALDALQARGIQDEEITKRFEKAAQWAREATTDNMQEHPFKTIFPP